MKYSEFSEVLKKNLKEDKKLISINETSNNNQILLSIIEEFIPRVVEYLNKKNEDENYKKKFKQCLGDVPLRINKMKG